MQLKPELKLVTLNIPTFLLQYPHPQYYFEQFEYLFI